MRLRSITVLTLALAAAGSASGARAAACTVPNTISNGQVADATKIMDNFNEVASCADSHSSGGSTNSVQINAGGGTFGSVGPLGDGQIIVGTTGSPPHAAALVAGANVSITQGVSTVTIAASGGSGGTPPAIRGSGIQASSASSYIVSWPPGTIAGDLAIIFVGGGWGISGAPSGWTLVDNQAGSYWSGSVLGRILTSTDISAGSVTVNMSGAYDAVVSIVTFQGTTTGISGVVSARNSSSSNRRTLSSLSISAGTTYLYFGSGRTSGTVTIGEGLALNSQSDGSAASGALYSASAHPFFGSVDFSYAGSGSGDYQAVVSITGP